jgi:DNA repair exonuclease SbcCD ATPase subunit
MPDQRQVPPVSPAVEEPEREGFCPTCGQHHLAESDTEELHAMLAKCERLEREVLAENDRLRAEVERLREAGDKLVDAIRALDSYAALGGAPMERTERADGAVEAWRAALAGSPSQEKK